MPDGQMPEEPKESQDWDRQKEVFSPQDSEKTEETEAWEKDKEQDNDDK